MAPPTLTAKPRSVPLVLLFISLYAYQVDCVNRTKEGRSDSRRGLLFEGLLKKTGEGSAVAAALDKKPAVAPVRQVELEKARTEAIAAYRFVFLGVLCGPNILRVFSSSSQGAQGTQYAAVSVYS